ncbi:MAG: HD domain-containing protein [Gemmatales bacterium]|nr:HD domain-containing protein [Gemmatales bacterium]MDW8175168.1 HD domain-containing protein [Gemmatales bacterium]
MSQAALVERVSALRRRLEEIAQRENVTLSQLSPRLRQLQEICQQAQALHQQTQLVEAQARELEAKENWQGHPAQELPGPRGLSWQTRHWLTECRACLQSLRSVGDMLSEDALIPSRLLASYQLTVSMVECLVRGLQALPEGILDQNRLAQGLGGWVNWLKTQIAAMRAGAERHRRVSQHILTLTHAIQSLCQRRPILNRPLLAIAEELADRECVSQPMELLSPSLPPERWAAILGWNTAQILARVIHRHREFRPRAALVLLAALLHEAGMATVSSDILEHPGPLSDAQRREIEAHVGISAEAVRLCCPQETWLVEGVLAHHERLDGSGYPAGRQGQAINSLARLLAMADTYAALCTPRPYRPAVSSRQALLEVLAEAERGRLDIAAAELLLGLSLYPIGSMVELSDGSVGQVIALSTEGNASTPPAQLVALLLDKHSQPLPIPCYRNLADATAPSIVRQVPLEELSQINPLGWWVQCIPT